MSKLLLILCFVSANSVFSQNYPRTIVLGQDTCIVFSVEQGKQLIIWDLQHQQCKQENEVLINEISLKDSIINNSSEIIKQYDEITILYNEQKKEVANLMSLSEKEKQLLEKQLRKEKTKRFISTTIGIVSTSIFAILYFTK
jgi:hypothetical protein